MYPSFFGKYANTPSADQSTSLSALTNNDLQIGVGTADNTGSNVNFAAANMKHVNGLAVVNLNGKTVPQTYFYDGNTGKASSVRAASKTTATVWPSVNFSSSTKPYSSSNTSSLKRYLAIVKPSTATTISTTATSGCEAWSLSYNVSQNTSSSQSVTSSRPGYYLGWVYSYKGEVETFTAPEARNYKLEVWGAEGGSSNNGSGGKGGYSYGNYNINTTGTKFYVCVGGIGKDSSSYNNRNSETPKKFYYLGGSGGGATHIATSIRGTGELSYYANYQDEVLIVAGGGGESEWAGNGGCGGGITGGNGVSTRELGLNGTGGQQNKGGTTHIYHSDDVITEATFGVGGYGCWPHSVQVTRRVTYPVDYGAQGGGGWYGGGGASYAGSAGGGSGHIGAGVTGVTISGDTEFPSPSGGKETGHTGNGYAIISQVSY